MPVDVPAGEDVIVQGEIGDRFFLVDEGEVEVFENGVFRRNEGPGESFGEIALLHDVPRTATVRTTVDTRLLALDRDQFLLAVTGHRRSHQLARAVSDDRWAPEPRVTAPRSLRRRREVAMLLIALAAAGIAVLAYGTHLMRALELQSVDARFSVRGTQERPPDIVVVGVDDRTFSELGVQWPFPRSLHGRVIDRLSEAGAKAVAV